MGVDMTLKDDIVSQSYERMEENQVPWEWRDQ